MRFGTAAARFPSPTYRPWPSARNHYPQRFAYLEEALLSRECDRL
ncbi:hypothetical protein [Mycolicibacterium sp. XJ1904]